MSMIYKSFLNMKVTTGNATLQMLATTNEDLLQRSVSQAEQCSIFSPTIEQALIWPPCLLHLRVICFAPPTVKKKYGHLSLEFWFYAHHR